jgi:hypothetical protein
MTELAFIPLGTAIKLVSIVVHAEEMLSPDGHYFDKDVIAGLLRDPDVRAVLDDKRNAVFLPLKRVAR